MTKNLKLFALIVAVFAFLILLLASSSQKSIYKNQITSLVLGSRTKQEGCVVNNALPDTNCTPGAILNSTKEQICKSGYSKSVRNVSEGLKKRVYEEYGITSHAAGEYEVDHFISLALGGSNDIANLWPEAANPKPGFHEKDKVENFLHGEMCAGKITLAQAQEYVSWKWLEAQQYARAPNPVRDLFIFVQNLFQ